MTRDLLILMDAGKCGVLIIILRDLNAAFDTVVYSLLVEDCKEIGIQGNASDYIRSYLENRTYCVQTGKIFSGVKPLERGVPQGSALGSFLF